MSEPKRISPLLDGFAMGEPISSHDGVVCCPAMKENSDKKYIVKILSVPQSQTQLDALLLTGAYPDAQAALAYFQELADGMLKETEILSRLSSSGGFTAYEGCQCVPMETGVGVQVYLLGDYRRSLDRQFRREPLTHLAAVNMGIDLCAALSVCRRAGYLYVDLKPGNVFLGEDGRYRIGDIGFVSMNSLEYAALPTRCRSRWTAPELQDPMATLNPTVDLYALGLMLYQAYNNGELPFADAAPSEPLPPPMYADYEMAEIILKACAPEAKDRWMDPAQMGQALVAYMQRNTVNDTPIIPPKAAPSEPVQPAPAQEESSAESDELNLIRELVRDETAPGEEDARDMDSDALSEEASTILAQADELIAHPAPAPAVAPEAPEIPMPQPETEEVEEPAPEDEEAEEAPALSQEELARQQEAARARRQKIGKRAAIISVCLLLAAAIGVGAYFFYTLSYLLEVSSLKLEGSADSLTVRVDSRDNSLITVKLTDTFGNQQTAAVSDGSAVFAELTPNSQYTVALEVSGLHKLTGQTTSTYSTQARTNVVSFTANAGAEDGSVILNFTVDGQDSDPWTVGYAAEGQEEQTVSFSGHMVTVSGLEVGSTYTFRLIPADGIYLVGNDTLTYTASKIVQAENLTVTGCDSTGLSVAWTAPEGSQVEGWSVRCYNDQGYDETLTTQELTATFTGVSPDQPHTVEVTAQGMTVCTRVYVTANPITVTAVHGNNDDPAELLLSWEYTGQAPEGGWLLMYTIDGSDDAQVLKCTDASAILSPKVPGAHYAFTLQAASGATVFGGAFAADMPEAQTFQGYDVSADNMELRMCRTPDVEDWDHTDLSESDYTTEFAPGEKASFSVYLNREYNVSYDDIVTAYVIRDAQGKLVSVDSQTRRWVDMWYGGYCELDVPSLPSEAGSYTLEIYFNGASVATQAFTVTA